MKFFSGKEDSDAPGHGIEPGLVTKACYDSTSQVDWDWELLEIEDSRSSKEGSPKSIWVGLDCIA